MLWVKYQGTFWIWTTEFPHILFSLKFDILGYTFSTKGVIAWSVCEDFIVFYIIKTYTAYAFWGFMSGCFLSLFTMVIFWKWFPLSWKRIRRRIRHERSALGFHQRNKEFIALIVLSVICGHFWESRSKIRTLVS